MCCSVVWGCVHAVVSYVRDALAEQSILQRSVYWEDE